MLAMGIKIYDSYLSREYVTKYNDYYTNRYLIANYSRYSLKGQIISWVRKVIGSVVLCYELSIRYRVSKFCQILWTRLKRSLASARKQAERNTHVFVCVFALSKNQLLDLFFVFFFNLSFHPDLYYFTPLTLIFCYCFCSPFSNSFRW